MLSVRRLMMLTIISIFRSKINREIYSAHKSRAPVSIELQLRFVSDINIQLNVDLVELITLKAFHVVAKAEEWIKYFIE